MAYFEFIAEVVVHELVHLVLLQFVPLLQRLVLILMISDLPGLLSFSLSQDPYLCLFVLDGPVVGIGEIA
jgi:hypothetical protein